jgi:hypothetical protein
MFSTKFATLFTAEKAMRWYDLHPSLGCRADLSRGGSLVFWGGTAVVGLLLLGNKIPVVKDDILKKIPVVGAYFIKQDNIPDSDKPF